MTETESKPRATDKEVPFSDEVRPVAEGAEAFVELLMAHGVSHIFLNPGTDTAPVDEAVVKARALGRPAPKMVVCPYEGIAVNAAYGHWMVSGVPQVVLVHVDCGTANMGGALHSAQRGRAAMLLCAGRAPITEGKGMRGARDGSIHWLQEQYDQHSLVRPFVKWDYELRRNENIADVVHRAFQMTSTEPCGPVYLTLPREVLMEPMKEVRIPAADRRRPPSTPQADPAGIEQAASWLARARYPLIITTYSGRNPEAVPALVELAELIAAPVIDGRTRVNFPTDHPLYMGSAVGPYLQRADVVLVTDTDVPYMPGTDKVTPGTRFVHIDIDPIKQDIPIWSFPMDLSIQADSAKAIPALTQALRRALTLDPAREQRRQALAREHESRRQAALSQAEAKAHQRPIAVEWLGHCLNEGLTEDCLVLPEAASALSRFVDSSEPGTFFRPGGSSLGWSMGAAMGARLAAPQRIPVALVGDGSFMFSPPVPALWSADKYHAPYLTIICNNHVYGAPRSTVRRYYPEGYSAMSGDFSSSDLDPSPDYALIAKACRAYGETVTEPDQVSSALRRGLDAVRSGQAAVLDVHVEKP